MMKARRFLLLAVFWMMAANPALAQNASPPKLTRQDAEAIALKAHPQIQAASFGALAAHEVTTEVRSAYYPQAYGDVTAAGALPDSRLAAGALTNPIVLNRQADGVVVSQLITDFGRTSNLSASARFRAKAEEQNVQATRADVLLRVDRAYWQALKAQTILKVAQETVRSRQLVVDQVTALEQSKLKSALDVSFAEVDLANAQLLLVRSQNDVKAAFAELSQALGNHDMQEYELVDEPSLLQANPDLNSLIGEALQRRPELASLKYESEAAQRYAKAERDLSLPTVSAVGAAGVIPDHQIANGLTDRYAAAGINVSIPIFNGRLFSARRAEANLRAQQEEANRRDLENRVIRDLRIAWLDANTAYQRLALTTELLKAASQALDLAQARYKLGLSSIVELSQTQLNYTNAQIEQTTAKYDYQIQMTNVSFEAGTLI